MSIIMKMRIIFVIFFTILMVGVIAITGSSATDDFKLIELTMATSFSSTHGVYLYLEKWTEMVNDATNGDINITIYPGDTLVSASDLHRALIDGVVDVIETDTAYDVAAFPLASAMYLPNLGVRSSVTATHIVNEFFHLDFEEFKGMKIMFAYGMTPAGILSQKPINKLEDMRDLQLRATGFVLDSMKALGARPVGMPITETYEALQKGTVEGVSVPLETLKGWNFADVVSYSYSVPVVNLGHHYIAMNKDVWESLPTKYQIAIEKINDAIVEMMGDLFDQLEKEGIQYGIENGVKHNDIKDEELERWAEALQPIVAQWIKDITAMGLDAQGTYNSLRKIVDRNASIYE